MSSIRRASMIGYRWGSRSIISVALLLLLQLGCIGPYYYRNQMRFQCRMLDDPVQRDRCATSVDTMTEADALNRLQDLNRMTPEKCKAFVDLWGRALDMRLSQYWDLGEAQVRDYFMRTLQTEPHLGNPIVLSTAEIWGAVALAYQFRGYDELIAEHSRAMRACSGIPDPPPRPNMPTQWKDAMDELYGGTNE
jgi:hypothetical protein